MLNKILGIFVVIFALTGCHSDRRLRSSVVKLSSKIGSCSGTQIEAPSGKKYILSAGHCGVLAEDGIISISTEDGGSYHSRVLEEDGKSDLLLLEAAPGIPAIKIANDISRFEHLRSFTHGHGYPTYSTEGVYIGEDIAQFMSDDEKCDKPKNKIEELELFGMKFALCIVKVVESVTTVKAVPGSSGGLIVNDGGELAGVVSAGNEEFNYLVTLKDINRFLQNR